MEIFNPDEEPEKEPELGQELGQEQTPENPELIERMEELQSKGAELEALLKENPDVLEKLDDGTKEKVKIALKGVLLGLVGIGTIGLGVELAPYFPEAVAGVVGTAVEGSHTFGHILGLSPLAEDAVRGVTATGSLVTMVAAASAILTAPFGLLAQKLFIEKK